LHNHILGNPNIQHGVFAKPQAAARYQLYETPVNFPERDVPVQGCMDVGLHLECQPVERNPADSQAAEAGQVSLLPIENISAAHHHSANCSETGQVTQGGKLKVFAGRQPERKIAAAVAKQPPAVACGQL
jgi:hypothetical protein